MAEHRISIGLCNGQRLDIFIIQIKDVALAFLAKHLDLLDIDYILSVTSHESTVLETLLYSF